jgi:predicted metalloendopeptidase
MLSPSLYIGTGGGAPAVPPVSSTIAPGDDFYAYVNRNWERHTRLPSYEDSFGVSEEIEMDVRNALLGAVEKARRSTPTAPLSVLASSFLHTASQRNSVLDLQRLLNTFDCMRDAADICATIGRLNRLQCAAPLSLVVNSDYYDSNKCCVYIYEASLGLPSKTYYRMNGASGGRTRVLTQYAALLRKVGRMMNIELLENAVGVESELLPYLSEGDIMGDLKYSYVPHTYRELVRDYSHIDWKGMLAAWGLPAVATDDHKYVVTNVKYLRHLDTMCAGVERTLETWRTWMRAQVILTYMKYLPPPYDDLHYALFDRALKGIAEKLPQKNLTLSVLMTYAQQDTSRMFVELAVPDGTKAAALRLVERLKAATLARLGAASWMTPSTRAAAIEKVRALGFQVAFPSRWRSETARVTIDPFRPLSNILALAASDSDRMIDDLTHGTCKKSQDKWTEGAFEVNAYYYPEGNLMVVPAGMLRPPFFDLRRSDAWNLGGIGAAIGHEITHGFDDEGRMFDSAGNYRDWWTPSDAEHYLKMSAGVKDLFDGTKYAGGRVNGALTLSENLADLGGLAIALTALHATLPEDVGERKKALQEFFISYAVSWRQKDRPKKARQALLLDSHAPPALRVNLIVQQFDDWYEAFDIHDGALFLPPEQRISFW